MHNQSGNAAPVFVDRTGRRRRLTVVAGTVMGLGLLTSFGLILAGLFFDTSVPLPGWSETKVQPPVRVGGDAPSRGEQRTSPTPRPEPVTSTAPPAPSLAPTTRTTTATAPSPRPSATVPGQGDQRRSTAKPTRTPGKP